MSSPLTQKKKNLFDQSLINAHQALSHSTRIEILANLLHQEILAAKPDYKSGLDIGCGDFSMAKLIESKSKSAQWAGADLYPLPEEKKGTTPWADYVQFDGSHLPFSDGSFDASIAVDMLHHAKPDEQKVLLKEAVRVSEYCVVKDHFEYGTYSRSMLKLMDFVGNYGYGVSVPSHYFTPTAFEDLVANSGAEIVTLKRGVHLYDHLPLVRSILRPNWHFIAVLRAR
jgi:SAM-dependent methyltransferase